MVKQIGPFELEKPIAQGGMGEVWFGHHIDSRRPVAVKVLTGRMTQRPQFRDTFRNEARAMSALDHPHIVSIFDFGEMKSSDSAGEVFGLGSPYIVMEYLPHTLATTNSVIGWRSFKRLMLELLDALCHAHSRGVIHRDIKPGNILVDEEGLSYISDFGIAFGTDDSGFEAENMRTAGTPEYMAPEQCHGMWRDFGPWTDLYAVGCIAFELCSGSVPFQGANQMSTMLTKLKGDVPELLPRFPVPNGLNDWLNRLLARDPENRYQCAADAAWVLRGLRSDFEGALEESVVLNDDETGLDPDTIISPRTNDGGEHSMSLFGKGKKNLSVLPAYEGMASGMSQKPILPYPVDWRALQRNHQRRPLTKTGLEMYAIRQPQIIGRMNLRDQLWRHLRGVHNDRKPDAILLSGPTGIGKTMIAKWLCETANELGVGTSMYGFHGEQEMPSHGLPAMLLRHLRCGGLSKTEIRGRILSLLRHVPSAAEEADALTELIAPPDVKLRDGGDSSTIRFFAPVERHAVLARQLDRMSRDRPIILWIDDVHFGFEALSFIEWFMSNERAAVLFVMTATAEDLADRAIETSIIESMVDDHQLTIFDVPPLNESDQRLLIERALPFEKDVIDRIASRTAGNPRFALDLITSLVNQDRLVMGESGYMLTHHDAIEMPETLAEVWDTRLDAFLSSHGEQDTLALELAACLGLQVHFQEWLALCRVADVNISPELRREMIEQRFVTESSDESGIITWHFAHGMLREALLRHARKNGRFEQHHTHAVNMLRVADASPSRIGKHLLAATQWNAALGPLERAVREAINLGDHRAAQSALLDWTDALHFLQFPKDRRDWLKIKFADAFIRYIQGALSESLKVTTKVLENASRRPYRRVMCECYLLLSSIYIKLAQFRNALGALNQLKSLSDRHLSSMEVAQVAFNRAVALEKLGQFADADDAYSHAESLFIGDDLIVDASIATLGRARIKRAIGETDQAVELAKNAGHALSSAGSQVGVSDALFQLGEVARIVDDLDKAEHHYRKAQRGYRRTGSNKKAEAEMMLAMVLVERQAFLEARLLLEQLIATTGERENRALAVLLHLLLANCCAQDESWIEWNEHVAYAAKVLNETPMFDFDIATYAERAALSAYQSNQIAAAELPQKIADQQFAVLRARPQEDL